MTARIDGLSYHIERTFGEKVPQCGHCGSHDLTRNYERDSFRCGNCGWELDPRHGVRMVPKDERVRRPGE